MDDRSVMHAMPGLAEAIQGCESGRAAYREREAEEMLADTLLAHPLLSLDEYMVGGPVEIGPNTMLPMKGDAPGWLSRQTSAFRSYTRTVKPDGTLRSMITALPDRLQMEHTVDRNYPVSVHRNW